MNWVADEHISRAIVERLQRDGHTGVFVADRHPGAADDVVLEWAARDQAVVLTADKDFGELVFRQAKSTHGVVLLRLAGLSSGAKADVVGDAVARHGARMMGSFTVIEPAACRIRSLMP